MFSGRYFIYFTLRGSTLRINWGHFYTGLTQLILHIRNLHFTEMDNLWLLSLNLDVGVYRNH